MKASNKCSSSAPPGEVVIRSDDGGVCFHLRWTHAGLWVQRDRKCDDTRARLIQSAVFADIEGFIRWCERDPVRFDYPLLSSAVRRQGGSMLQTHGEQSSAQRDHLSS